MYKVTKTVITYHDWENDEMAEDQCAAMRGDVSFERIGFNVFGKTFDNRVDAQAYALSQVMEWRF